MARLCACGQPIKDRHKRVRRCRACYEQAQIGASLPTAVAPATVAEDQTKRETGTQLHTLRKKYREALDRIGELEREATQTQAVDTSEIQPVRIEPKAGSRTGEGTVVVAASDWHVEEQVRGPEVSGLNRYNAEIASRRAAQFFQHAVRLTQILQQDIRIDTMVLALLGDFITNDIHDELKELTDELPVQAILTAQDLLAGGIQYILNQTTLQLVIPCHSGNHARTTKTTHFATEPGHSLEYLMYRHLAAYFRHEPRVQFHIANGYHSYVQVYDQVVRFHHGHAIRYAGGVGGIYIPVNKAIAQWNKARRADLDVFGHFHQLRDGGNFVCNGSMIGYNGFALSIKADFERPKQALFLLDKKRGRTCTWPVLFEVTK